MACLQQPNLVDGDEVDLGVHGLASSSASRRPNRHPPAPRDTRGRRLKADPGRRLHERGVD